MRDGLSCAPGMVPGWWRGVVGLDGGRGSFSLAGKHVKEGPSESSLKVTEPSMFSSLSSGDICVTRPRTPTGAGSEETNPRR